MHNGSYVLHFSYLFISYRRKLFLMLCHRQRCHGYTCKDPLKCSCFLIFSPIFLFLGFATVASYDSQFSFI